MGMVLTPKLNHLLISRSSSEMLRSIEDLVLDSVLERNIQSKMADPILLAVFSLCPPDVESNLFVRALNLLSDGK